MNMSDIQTKKLSQSLSEHQTRHFCKQIHILTHSIVSPYSCSFLANSALQSDAFLIRTLKSTSIERASVLPILEERLLTRGVR